MSRAKAVEALKAEGVRASALEYTLQHKLPLYAEDQWWHHKPVIPDLPGSEQANATALALPISRRKRRIGRAITSRHLRRFGRTGKNSQRRDTMEALP